MLDIAPTELLLVALVALVVIGPKDLPRVLRVVGQWVGRARGVARHFRSGFDEMVRQAEFEEIEKKWAEENARIMREHPQDGTAAAATPAPARDPAYPYPSLESEVDSAVDSFAPAGDPPVTVAEPPAPPGHTPDHAEPRP